MNSALQVAEIVECILEYARVKRIDRPGWTQISQFAGLKHCLTVNKLWFHECARLIWNNIDISRLREIGDLERQQVYANFVTVLRGHSSLPSSYIIPSQLEFPVLQSVNFIDPNFFEESLYPLLVPSQLRFPVLESVNISSDKISEELLYPLLVPSLRSLWLFQTGVSDQFLLDVIERCPELKLFTFSGSPKMTTAGLQKFLVVTRYSSLTLRYMSECIGWETLCKAAENTFIKSLGIPKCDEYAFSQVRKLVKHPFPSLYSLGCTSFEGGIEDLLCMTKTLKWLDLDDYDFNNTIRFSKRPECSIEHLTINAKYGSFDKHGLIELAKYSNLNSVHIKMERRKTYSTQVVYDTWVDDKWIDEFTRFTPSLDRFELDGIHINVTSKGLSAIGRNCPDITDLELWWGDIYKYLSVDKNDFSPHLPCLFPKLKLLTVDYGCFSEGGMDDDVIRWHFPIVDFEIFLD